MLSLLTNPDADADGSSDVRGTLAQGSEWEHSHIPPVHGHGRQGNACSLNRNLQGKTKDIRWNFNNWKSSLLIWTSFS